MSKNELMHPREFAAEQQEILDYLLPELQHTVDAANFELSFISADDEEAVNAVAGPAISELDELWPYDGHDFMVQGTWYGKEYEAEERGVIFSEIKPMPAFQRATSDGFGVSMREDGTVFIGLGFHADGFIGTGNHYRYKFEVINVADMREISLAYLRSPLEDGESLLRLARTAFSYYDGLFRLYMGESSEFYRVNHHRQKQFVDKLLAEANDAVTAPSITLVAEMKELPIAYVRTPVGAPLPYAVILPQGKKSTFKLRGQVLGVAMLEKELLDEKPFTSKSDLLFPNTGLCAIIDPGTHEVGGREVSGAVLVPIKKIGSMTLSAW